jgi:hypothetical protein
VCVQVAEGKGAEALEVLEERQLASLAAQRFGTVKEGRDELLALYLAVKCEATLLAGRGLAAAYAAVAAVHAMLASAAGPRRLMAAAAAAAAAAAGDTAASNRVTSSSEAAADEEEGTAATAGGRAEMAASATDLSAYGRMVCNQSGEASHFRLMHQVARALTLYTSSLRPHTLVA